MAPPPASSTLRRISRLMVSRARLKRAAVTCLVSSQAQLILSQKPLKQIDDINFLAYAAILFRVFAHFMPDYRAPYLARFSRDVGFHRRCPRSASDESRVRGKEQWNPTSREKRARYPDFLYAAPSNGHVCGFHRGKPHEVHQRQQTSQEIRGYGAPVLGEGTRAPLVE